MLKVFCLEVRNTSIFFLYKKSNCRINVKIFTNWRKGLDKDWFC